MNFKSKITILAFAILSVLIAACNDTTTTPADPTPEPVKNLKATSIDSTTIKIKWDASTSESDASFAGYIISRTGDDNSVKTDTVNKLKNPLTTTGLKQGTVYTFDVKALFANGKSSTSATIKWSPAYRFVQNYNSAPIYIYETETKTYGSGLQLFDAAKFSPVTITFSKGDLWNFGLDTRNSKILVGSPTKINYNYTGTPGLTEISDNYFFDAGSLDEVFDSEALDKGTFNEMVVDLSTDLDPMPASNVIFIVRVKNSTGQYNYAKILIKKGSDGNWLQGTEPNRYLECVVSYQVKPDVPYAKRAF